MTSEEVRHAIETLPVHSISGYEWECEECHYHFSGHECWVADHGTATKDEEVDSRGEPSQHLELLDRDAVLALLP